MCEERLRGHLSASGWLAPFSLAQEPEGGSDLHHKMMNAMARPRSFDRTRHSPWVSQMEYYLESAGVVGGGAKPRVAVSSLDFDRMDWFTIGLGESQRPQTCTEGKEVIGSHFKRCRHRKS